MSQAMADALRRRLAQRAQAGDKRAYETLLRQSMVLSRRTARRFGAPPEVLDDIVQETLISVHAALHTFDANRSYDAWLAAICRRRSADALRSLMRLGRCEVHAPVAYESFSDDEADPAHLHTRRVDRRRLELALSQLPPAQRDAAWRIFMAEEPAFDAGKASGRSAGAVRVNLSRALRALRVLLVSPSSKGVLEPRS
ncbi:RNA polymerase sigma factor [Ideonella sp. YS5]|uniref:RNA polymerase sigma factor n=1 Tax=Ideonella sp. YS5 TaxID=3453714 RepID=UPI003EEA9834